jgi:ribonuclease HI
MERCKIYIDGASSGNPGPSGIGVVVYQGDNLIDKISCSIGEATNNVAEYKALITALKYAKKKGIERFRIYSDSELLVKQMAGEYLVRDKVLKRLHKDASSLIKDFIQTEILHISRKENKEANRLAEGGICQ